MAKHFNNYENVEINFFVRDANLAEIQKNEFQVKKGENKFFAKTHIVNDNPLEIGIVDFILIVTKGYDLETITFQLRPCISKDTVILPLFKGVDSLEQI